MYVNWFQLIYLILLSVTLSGFYLCFYYLLLAFFEIDKPNKFIVSISVIIYAMIIMFLGYITISNGFYTLENKTLYLETVPDMKDISNKNNNLQVNIKIDNNTSKFSNYYLNGDVEYTKIDTTQAYIKCKVRKYIFKPESLTLEDVHVYYSE